MESCKRHSCETNIDENTPRHTTVDSAHRRDHSNAPALADLCKPTIVGDAITHENTPPVTAGNTNFDTKDHTLSDCNEHVSEKYVLTASRISSVVMIISKIIVVLCVCA